MARPRPYSQFLGKVMTEINKCLQIQKVNTTAYHPQADGLVERFRTALCWAITTIGAPVNKDTINRLALHNQIRTLQWNQRLPTE
jgi:hypothetical protein